MKQEIIDLTLIKKKLIEKIQSSNDEILIVELLDTLEQHNVVTNLSAEQRQELSERINRVEEGKAVYYKTRLMAESRKNEKDVSFNAIKKDLKRKGRT